MFNQTKQKRSTSDTETSTTKRRRNKHQGMIVENKPLPVRILSCQEGNPTQFGTNTLHFGFQHIVSLEAFNSTVFENSVPHYVDHQIINAVLPPELQEYELEDLVDKGLFIQVTFRKKEDKTFINVVGATALNNQYQKMLAILLEKEQNDQRVLNEQMKDIEEVMEDQIHQEEPDIDLEGLDEEEIEPDEFEEYDEDDLKMD